MTGVDRAGRSEVATCPGGRGRTGGFVTTAEGVSVETERLGVFRQLFRFVGIGGVCGVIDVSTYMLLVNLAWPNFLARSLAFVLGTTLSYLINRRVTFRGASTGNTGLKAGGFALVYLVTYFVNTGTNQLCVSALPAFGFVHGEQLRWFLCWAIGQGVGTLINFVMLKWVVFRD